MGTRPPIAAETVCRIDFRRNGNCIEHLCSGWAVPETDLTWTLGDASSVVMPRPREPSLYRLYLAGRPFTAEPMLPSQRLLVRVNGREVGRFVLNELFAIGCDVPWRIIERNEDVVRIELEHPDSRRPRDVKDSADDRRLGFAMQEMQLERFSGPALRAAPIDAGTPLFRHFAAVATRRSEQLAIDDGTLALTYGELLGYAQWIAARITETVAPDGIVAVLLPDSTALIAAALGCCAAGRCCAVLGHGQPAAAIRMAIAEAEPAALIATDAIPEFSRELRCITLPSDDVPASSADAVEPAPLDAPSLLMFTSGSTGHPKGVVHSQRTWLAEIAIAIEASEPTPDDRYLSLSPLSTYAGLREALSVLLVGAALHVVDIKQRGMPEALTAMRHLRITVTRGVPSVLRVMARHPDARSSFRALRVMHLAGEQIVPDDIVLLRRVLPAGCRIVVGYGSTEAGSVFRHVIAGLPDPMECVPCGRPVTGVEVRLIGWDGQQIPAGAVGELVVRSRLVAIGSRSSGRYIPGPFAPDPAEPSARVVRTGDLFRRRRDGLFEMLGRLDRQIKIRGQRVEPEGIEAVLRRLPGISDAAVVPVGADEALRLVGFIVPAVGAQLAQEALLSHLRQLLPEPARPSELRIVPELPRLPTQKLDLAALAATVAPPLRRVGAKPATLLDTVRNALIAVLGEERFDLDRSFEEAGGDSLRLLEFTFWLERALGRRVGTSLLTLRMRPAEIAASLAATQFELTPQALMLRFESLGSNCEFGMVQRRYGAEPYGLLRFAGTTPRGLIAALDSAFKGIGDPGTVEVVRRGKELAVREHRFGFNYHTFVPIGEADPGDMQAREERRIRFLAAKLREELASAEKMFVYKSRGSEDDAAMDALRTALRGYASGNALLWVCQEDASHPGGTVRALRQGLLRGAVDRFATEGFADDVSLECWLSICQLAYAMRQDTAAS